MSVRRFTFSGFCAYSIEPIVFSAFRAVTTRAARWSDDAGNGGSKLRGLRPADDASVAMRVPSGCQDSRISGAGAGTTRVSRLERGPLILAATFSASSLLGKTAAWDG